MISSSLEIPCYPLSTTPTIARCASYRPVGTSSNSVHSQSRRHHHHYRYRYRYYLQRTSEFCARDAESFKRFNPKQRLGQAIFSSQRKVAKVSNSSVCELDLRQSSRSATRLCPCYMVFVCFTHITLHLGRHRADIFALDLERRRRRHRQQLDAWGPSQAW